ncbi:NAD(P)-dependent alcohol dehydrogenase [Archangium sp.]|jgi:NADPH:quinone reductase-like Zn-dependent oxidoreductase|uniref:NAD(P)-dependent alcohol dehydrogenase n=1 Tax=Archangium sp. TaxID=1872627 RepID=UPI002ED7921A
MKAIVYEGFGAPDVLQLKELPKPTPKDDEVLIRVRATTVTAGDWRVRSRQLPRGFGLVGRLVLGSSRPRQPILGTELAGDIEAIGTGVSTFKVGDPVFAFSGTKMGCYVEYKCMPANGLLALKPATLGYEEAAALSFGGTTALDFFRRGQLQKGDKVLINGASGGVGTAAVQLAKHFGAEVTAVCSTVNLDLVKSIGADKAIDYTQEDFTRNGEAYDIILDTAGTAPFSRCGDSLKDGGRLLLVLATLKDTLSAPWQSLTTGKKVIAGPVKERAEDLRLLARLAEAGEFKPVIDRRYPFERMADAHRYVDAGHKKGNVVITVG